MSDIDLFSITSKLESGKIKDRNEGLEMLEQITRSGQRLKAKVTSAILEALFGMMNGDAASYTKNPTATTRSRLEMASYTLRRLMGMNPKKLKYRSVKECLNYMTTRFFDIYDSIFEPVAMNFSRTIHELISIDTHRDHLTIDDWVKLTNTIIKALTLQALINTNEKFFTDLLLSLKCLLQVRAIALMSIRQDLTDFLILYFRNIRKETSATSVALEIVNQTLVLFSTASVHDGRAIVRCVVKAVGSFTNTNLDSLRDQLQIFGMLTSEYSSADIIYSMAEETDVVVSQESAFRDDLVHWIDGMLVQLTKASQTTLSLSMVQFYNTSKPTSTWFNSSTMGLSSPMHSRTWLSMMSVVCLLNSLCGMDSLSEQPTEQTWKRRKIDTQSFVSALTDSETPLHFLLNLLDSQSILTQTLGLQLLVFHITSFKTDCSTISIADVMRYEKPELSPWVSLAIRTMLQYGWAISTDECNQVLRINLQMIKEPLTTDIACQLIIQILSIPSFVITDRAINQLIRSLFEVPHVYGPAHISNDSMKFWMSISDHSKFLNNGEFRTGDKITAWLNAKINKSTFEGLHCDLFPYFILWLSEKQINYDDGILIHDDMFTRFNSKWSYLGALPSRMLNTKIARSHPSNVGKFQSPKPPTKGFDDLDNVVSSIITILAQCDNPEDVVALSRLIAYGTVIYQGIYTIPQLSSSSERLKHDIIRMLESLSISGGSKDAVLDELNKIKILNNGGLFINEYIDPTSLLSGADFANESLDILVTGDDFDNFGTVRKHRDRTTATSSYIFSDMACVSTTEQKVISLIINLNKEFDGSCASSIHTEQVLNYISTLPAEKRAIPFYTLLNILEDKDSRHRLISLTSLVDALKPCLNSEESQRSPLVRCSLLKLCLLFSDDFYSKGSTIDKQFFTYGFEFVLTIFNNEGICDEESYILLGELLLLLISKGHALNMMDSPDYDKKFLKIWGEKSNFVRVKLVTATSAYLSNLNGLYQLKFFNSLVKEIGSPDLCREIAISFCIALESFATVGYPVLVSSLSLLLNYHGSIHFSNSLHTSLKTILSAIGQRLPPSETLTLELLSSWYTEHHNFANFPHRLFGYQDHDSFLADNVYELYSICKANKRSNPGVIEEILRVCGVEEEIDMALSALSLTIPLSFTSSGVKNMTASWITGLVDKSLISYQSFLIVQKFIELADVSKESDFFKCIPGLKENQNLNWLISSSSKELYSLSNISVGLTSAVHEIQQYEPDLLWTPQVTHFISQRLMKTLSETKLVGEQIIALRRLKLLFILGHGTFSNDSISLPLIVSLNNYLSEVNVHDDVSLLIEFVLRNSPDLTTGSLYPNGLVQIFDSASKFCQSGNRVRKSLREYLLDIYKGIDQSDHWKTILSPFANVLSTQVLEPVTIDLQLKSLHNALWQVSRVPAEGVVSNVFSAMSLVFSNDPEKSILDDSFKCDRSLAKLLLESRDLASSDYVKAFIARYLGRFYLQTGDDLRFDKTDSLPSVKSDMREYYGSLRAICDAVTSLRNTVDDLQEVMVIESILGCLMYDYQQDPTTFEARVDVSSHLTSHASTIIAIDSFIFSLLHPVSIEINDKKNDLDTILSKVHTKRGSVVDWCQKVSLAILYKLSKRMKWFEKLMTYLVLYKKRSLKFMNVLWMAYAYEFKAVGTKHLLQFLDSMLSIDPGALDATKLDLVVQLSFLVRASAKGDCHDGSPDELESDNTDGSSLDIDASLGAEGDTKESFKGSYVGSSRGSTRVSSRRAAIKDTPEPKPRCRNYLKFLYTRMDLMRLCLAAETSGHYKFSLALFEESMMPVYPHIPRRTLQEESSTLFRLYEGIDDLDLIYGVPIVPSLDYAVDLLNMSEGSTMKQVMFNSARFESGISSGTSESARGDMLSSLTRNSFNGLAGLVNDYADPAHKLEHSYDWSWKLNQWDIAAPEKPRNQDEMIYTALKAMKEGKPPSDIEELCTKLMVGALDFHEKERLKTLCTLVNVDEITRSSVIGLKPSITSFIDATDMWFNVTPFAEFENIISARRIAFETLAEYKKEPEVTMAVALEFTRFGRFARLHGEHQKSVNNAVLLDKLAKSSFDNPLVDALKKVSSFESASTLWSQGETFIPIAILMKELNSPVDLKTRYFPAETLNLSGSFIQSYLVKWNSESKQKKFENIMAEYVKPALSVIQDVSSLKEKAEAFHNIAYFCYKQLRSPAYDQELQRKRSNIETKQKELLELKSIVTNKKAGDSERRDAKRFYTKLTQLLATQKDAYTVLLENKNECINTAIRCLLHTLILCNEYDNEDVDKLCALWLQFSQEDFVNGSMAKYLKTVPCHKFIPWLNQLCSRLSNDGGSFQSVLQDLIGDISFRHPFHSLYFLVNLRVHRKYDLSRTDKSIASRVEAADAVVSKLISRKGDFGRRVMVPIDELCNHAIKLATEKAKGITVLRLDNLNVGTFWLKTLPTWQIPLATINNVPISPTSEYMGLPRIYKVNPEIVISQSGISLPKIMKIQMTDGSIQKLLLKGSTDDLRQDAIMEQVFEKVNLILRNNTESRKRNLRIRTYKVIPLGPQAGMIEFVANSMALADILKPYHSRDSLSFDNARMMMKEVQQKTHSERIDTYETIAEKTPPCFRYFFFDTFLNMDEWYRSRQIYTRGLVTTSIVGYILGLGDRHLNNVLLDKKTGEPIHIDLGVAFDQGKLLPVPELVPFRLTRDIVDALGVTGAEGAFRKGSELVFQVLRENSEKIIGILDVLKYDPLYTWAISPVRRKKLQEIEADERASVKVEGDGSEAVAALKGVEEKLAAHGLSVEATVQELIQEATDVKNLAVIYLGWAPFY